MERIHGKHTIRRRTEYKKSVSYTSYKQILIEDFHNLCGYCGKDLNVISCERQTDHLIPCKFCEDNGRFDLIDQYENLVNTCRVCNGNKSSDWPTKSFDLLHNGKEGYIDPASDEFDTHLARDSEGRIVPLTPLGHYMYKKFRFDIRLTDICWLVQQLDKKLKSLGEKLEQAEDSENLYVEYYQINEMFRKNIALLKVKKEMI